MGGPGVVDWVATGRTLEFFHSPDHYRAFVESGRDEMPLSPFERAKAGLVLGGERFVEGVKKMLKESCHDHAAARLRALARTQVSPAPEGVREAVRRGFADLSPCRRRRLEMFALGRLMPLSMKEIGEAVGTGASAVSKACKSIGSRLAEKEGLARGMRLVVGLLQSETASDSTATSRTRSPRLSHQGGALARPSLKPEPTAGTPRQSSRKRKFSGSDPPLLADAGWFGGRSGSVCCPIWRSSFCLETRSRTSAPFATWSDCKRSISASTGWSSWVLCQTSLGSGRSGSSYNLVADIQPLLANAALGSEAGHRIDLRGNPLDESDCGDLGELMRKGVEVLHDVACPSPGRSH